MLDGISRHYAGMKKASLITALLLLAASSAANAQRVYKCTGEDGSVTFQDHACAEPAKKKATSDGAAIAAGDAIPLPGIGAVALSTLDYMETTVLPDGSRSTSVAVRSRPGANEKMSVMLTFMPNPNGAIPSKAKHQIMARKVVQQFTGMDQFDTDFHDFESASGGGVYSVLHDPQYPDRVAPEGEYATIAAGQIVNPDAIVLVAIYSDGVDNKAFEDALAVAETFTIASAGTD